MDLDVTTRCVDIATPRVDVMTRDIDMLTRCFDWVRRDGDDAFWFGTRRLKLRRRASKATAPAGGIRAEGESGAKRPNEGGGEVGRA